VITTLAGRRALGNEATLRIVGEIVTNEDRDKDFLVKRHVVERCRRRICVSTSCAKIRRQDKTLKVWELEDRRVPRTLVGDTSWSYAAAVTPDAARRAVDAGALKVLSCGHVVAAVRRMYSALSMSV
jgi:hypothetical protein